MRYLRELYRMLSSLAKRKMYWAKEAKRLEMEYADIPEEPICAEQ